MIKACSSCLRCKKLKRKCVRPNGNLEPCERSSLSARPVECVASLHDRRKAKLWEDCAAHEASCLVAGAGPMYPVPGMQHPMMMGGPDTIMRPNMNPNIMPPMSPTNGRSPERSLKGLQQVQQYMQHLMQPLPHHPAAPAVAVPQLPQQQQYLNQQQRQQQQLQLQQQQTQRRRQRLNILYTTQYLGLSLILLDNIHISIKEVSPTAPNSNLMLRNDAIVGINGKTFVEMGVPIVGKDRFHGAIGLLKSARRPMFVMLERWVTVPVQLGQVQGGVVNNGGGYLQHQQQLAKGCKMALATFPNTGHLSTPLDTASLSARECYIRSHFVELFIATAADVSSGHSQGAQNLHLNQIGLRCVYCFKLKARDPAKHVIYQYPRSISRIHQTVAFMQRWHFESCDAIPQKVLHNYNSLKTTIPRGGVSPQSYWDKSAREIGLVDTADGIRLCGMVGVAYSLSNAESVKQGSDSTPSLQEKKDDIVINNILPKNQEDDPQAATVPRDDPPTILVWKNGHQNNDSQGNAVGTVDPLVHPLKQQHPLMSTQPQQQLKSLPQQQQQQQKQVAHTSKTDTVPPTTTAGNHRNHRELHLSGSTSSSRKNSGGSAGLNCGIDQILEHDCQKQDKVSSKAVGRRGIVTIAVGIDQILEHYCQKQDKVSSKAVGSQGIVTIAVATTPNSGGGGSVYSGVSGSPGSAAAPAGGAAAVHHGHATNRHRQNPSSESVSPSIDNLENTAAAVPTGVTSKTVTATATATALGTRSPIVGKNKHHPMNQNGEGTANIVSSGGNPRSNGSSNDDIAANHQLLPANIEATIGARGDGEGEGGLNNRLVGQKKRTTVSAMQGKMNDLNPGRVTGYRKDSTKHNSPKKQKVDNAVKNQTKTSSGSNEPASNIEVISLLDDSDDENTARSGKGVNEKRNDKEEEEELVIVGTKGQNSLIDFPHSRSNCVTHPFTNGNKVLHCLNCYCYVCDTPASDCKEWPSHCEASHDEPRWREERERAKRLAREQTALAREEKERAKHRARQQATLAVVPSKRRSKGRKRKTSNGINLTRKRIGSIKR